MRKWSENKAGKTSGAVVWVLQTHGYLKLDKQSGIYLIRAKSLIKERSYQEVEGWFMKAYSNAYPILMAELQNILQLNIGKGLQHEPEDLFQEKRFQQNKKILHNQRNR